MMAQSTNKKKACLPKTQREMDQKDVMIEA
jgi:hypothetical protein